MLLDLNNAGITVDPLPIAPLIAWLEKQPADGQYVYTDGSNCLLAQYFRASGYRDINLGNITARLDGERVFLPISFQRIAGYYGGERTFGAALERAKNLAA